MAWFLNHYKCDECTHEWDNEWSCMCDDDCPNCGARHMSPTESEDLTKVIELHRASYVVYWSPETAEHEPDYRELGRFNTLEQAEEFLRT